jgi:hypothetical protein
VNLHVSLVITCRISACYGQVTVLRAEFPHNVGTSFTSLMNYATDDYSMGHILRFARESRRDTLTIDLLNGTGDPDGLLKEAISELPRLVLKDVSQISRKRRIGSEAHQVVFAASSTLTLPQPALWLSMLSILCLLEWSAACFATGLSWRVGGLPWKSQHSALT